LKKHFQVKEKEAHKLKKKVSNLQDEIKEIKEEG
jgi:hypothetical protein